MKGGFSLHIPKMFVFATFGDVFDDDDVVDIVWPKGLQIDLEDIVFFIIGKYIGKQRTPKNSSKFLLYFVIFIEFTTALFAL